MQNGNTTTSQNHNHTLSTNPELTAWGLPQRDGLITMQVPDNTMQPTFNRGDFVVVDTNQTAKVDAVYAVEYGGFRSIKRLGWRLGGTVDVIYDNQHFNSQTCKPSDFEIVGRVVAAAHLRRYG